MSTRSGIGIENENGTVTAIYCHWDGGPKHQLPILTAHYDTEEKAKQLIALGALSILGPEIGEKQNFNNPCPEWCLAYHRDRGEEEQPGMLFRDRAEYYATAAPHFSAEYLYLFSLGEWEYRPASMTGRAVQ